jgi:glutamate-1-semialdehyde 2,1-aminomutase
LEHGQPSGWTLCLKIQTNKSVKQEMKNPIDQKIWEEELSDFVPDKIIDIHTHLWSEAHAGRNTETKSGLRLNASLDDLKQFSESLWPGRETHYLLLGTPLRDIDFEGHNDWLADEAAKDPLSAAAMVVTPSMSPDYIERMVKNKGAAGLKPYRVFASDPANCALTDYLPEPLIEAADSLGLAVTLHLSKKDGIADPQNQKDLARLVKKYPNVQWILAHCARAFNPFSLEKSVHFLKHLPNIWYDLSAVCDVASHALLLKHEDRRRIMFGSDNIAAGGARGSYITYGRAWEFYAGNSALEHCDGSATYVVYEQLRAMRRAAELLELGKLEIGNIFFNNARNLFGKLKKKGGKDAGKTE